MIKLIQKKVEEKLKELGIEVYFISFEQDEGNPYFAYTFDKNLVEEAKKEWEEGYVLGDCYDDYSFEEDFERIVDDVCQIILQRKGGEG
jgi:hypothetical protein